jgi:putative membrane protein
VVIVRVLSIGYAIVQFHAFELDAAPDRLVARYGLLTRVQAALKYARIQQILIEESLLHRLFGRATVRVRSAAQHAVNDGAQQLSWLAPVIPREATEPLLKRVMPSINWSRFNWQPLAPDALKLVLMRRTVLLVLLLVPATGFVGLQSLWILTLWPLVALSAWLYVRRTRIHVSTRSVAVFHGGISHLTIASPVDRIQSLRLTQGPVERAFGLANIEVDVAGSIGSGMRQLKLPLIELARAQRIHRNLMG